MKRGEPPKRKKALERGESRMARSALARGEALARGKGPNARSRAREQQQQTRRVLAAELGPRTPCELVSAIARIAPEWDGCTRWAEHWHERRKAGAGGSRVNRANLVATCDRCNGWLEDDTRGDSVVLLDGRPAVVREGDPEWAQLSRRNDR